MKPYILDTDHVSLSQREQPAVLQRMAEVGHHYLAVSIITVEEQIKGRFKLIKRASNGQQLVQAYRDLQANLAYFNTLQVLPFDDAANARYEALCQQKIRIGSQDLRIAAIVLSVNGILVTRNQRDFGKVPDLILEDWSI
jgi:tRNA(fMet)-specific endonuclease VapC